MSRKLTAICIALIVLALPNVSVAQQEPPDGSWVVTYRTRDGQVGTHWFWSYDAARKITGTWREIHR